MLFSCAADAAQIHSPRSGTTRFSHSKMLSTILRSARAPTRTTVAASLTTVGVLSALTVASMATSSRAALCENNAPKKALGSWSFQAFKVRSVEPVTHDTKRVVFDLPTPEHEVGLTVASFVLARAKVNGSTVVRPYTPVSTNEEKGKLELVVKGYANGTMSKHITNLKPGDELEFMGPMSKFTYKANQYKTVALLAAGSGLTPVLQLVKEILRNPEDKTQIVLVFGNKTEADIILRDELDALAAKHPQFKVHYVLSSPPPTWTGKTGHIDKQLVQELLPAPSKDLFVGVCGPPAMMESLSGNPWLLWQGSLSGALKELGYAKATVFKY